MAHPAMSNLLAFEAVARRSSFAAAATELHLTPSAVSHQVARLEAQVGVRLFERNARGVSLSVPGRRYLDRVAGALADIEAATEELREEAANSLHVHATPGFAGLWLVPRLGSFTREHPRTSLTLSASYAVSDVAHGEADVDIRYGRPDWPDLVVWPLFTETVLPVASPAYLAEHPVDDLPGLRTAALIQSTVNLVQWSAWFTRYAGGRGPDRFAMQFDRSQLSLDAAAQGLGVALESTVLAEEHLRTGRVRPVFPGGAGLEVQAHFAVHPRRRAARPPVAAFLRWLRAQTATTPAPGPVA